MEPFDLYSPDIDANPFPGYARLREQHPCYWSPGAGVWILSRYEDVFRAAQDWETYSSTGGNLVDELPERAGATLGTTDPPRHDRLRALSMAAFSRKSMGQLTDPALEIADRSLENILAKGEFEFVEDFSSQITVGLLFRTMGLPIRDHSDIRRKVILRSPLTKPRRAARRRTSTRSNTSRIFSKRRWRSGASGRPTTSSHIWPKPRSTATGFRSARSS